jgi:hypothetical protein
MSPGSMTVNVAIGKPARQSSLSQWSTDLGAGGAVTGAMPWDYGFHTDFEADPWWMVDLLRIYPVDRIVLHNRLRGYFDRARNCRVEVSEDGTTWLLIHAGLVLFNGGDVGPPLTLPLGKQVLARYVRVSLPGREVLHLAQVEVFADAAVDSRDQALRAVRTRYGLEIPGFVRDYSTQQSINLNKWGLTYRIDGQPVTAPDFRLIGVKITYIGRLGNQLIQLINATLIARRLSLKYVVVLDGGLIRLPSAFSAEGLCYLADTAHAPERGGFLTGNFFFTNDLSKLLEGSTDEDRYRAVQEIIRPRLMRPFHRRPDPKHDDELTVHFRSGDVFNDPSHAGYTQPPLSFYTIVARHLLRQGRIARARLVFEDRANPCVDAFIAFLEALTVPHRLQNGFLEEDLHALIDARHVVFGYGTFGVAVCLLSRRIETLFLFEPMKTREYDGIPSVGSTVQVRDLAGGYTKPGEWRQTPEQRQLMLDYPESALEMLL